MKFWQIRGQIADSGKWGEGILDTFGAAMSGGNEELPLSLHIIHTVHTINIIDKVMKDAIRRLCREKGAVILAHYYQTGDLQDIADFTGDSLALAQWAARTEAKIIVLCGVRFMAETAKILCPEKKVLLPDAAAGCSLSDSCPADAFAAFVHDHPHHIVVTYVNTCAEVKALSHITVTSTNARPIIDSLPEGAPILFAPDRNLGNYLNSQTGREMVLWDGACHVHEAFSLEKIIALKQQYPGAELIAHPECKEPILRIADYVGSTAALLRHTQQSEACEFIVATESGVLHRMRLRSPHKTFHPAPPNDSTCACSECSFMRLNTLSKLHDCLRDETPEIILPPDILHRARIPIQRMLTLSEQIGL